GDKMIGRVGGQSFGTLARPGGRGVGFSAELPSSLFNREFGNELQLVLVEELKIFLLEPSDGVALLVAHDYRNADEVDAGFKGRGLLAGGGLRSVGVGGRRSWSGGSLASGRRCLGRR